MNEVKKNQKGKLSRFNKGFYIGLAITVVVQAILATAIFLYEFYYARVTDGAFTPLDLTNTLSDIFIIPSILCILFYLLVFVSREGAFDAIVYSTKLVFYSIFARNIRSTKLPSTYGEYRAMRMAKERSSTLFLLFAAIPFFIVGIVFTILAGVGYAII